MQFTLDPNQTENIPVDRHHNQHNSHLERRILKLNVALPAGGFIAGPETSSATRTGVLCTLDSCEPRSIQWWVVSLSNTVAGQERQSQPESCTQC